MKGKHPMPNPGHEQTPAEHGPATRTMRPLARPDKDANGRAVVTPEMRTLAEAIAHPDGDPYENARRLGLYCEQCG